MDQQSYYDAVVIGAGVEGSSTAYNIANKGVKRVALLEQVKTCVLLAHVIILLVVSTWPQSWKLTWRI